MTDNSINSYHHGDLRHALIEAAISLVNEKGPNALSLREVAKRAGVSHTAPYRHFQDKNALLGAIARQGFIALARRMQAVAKKYPEDPRKQIIEAGVAYVELALQSPEISQLMFGGYIDQDSCSEELMEDGDKAFEGLLQIIRNGQNTGLYIEQDTRFLALAVWSVAHGLAMLIAGGQLPEELTGTEDQINYLSRTLGSFMLDGICKT